MVTVQLMVMQRLQAQLGTTSINLSSTMSPGGQVVAT